MSNTTSIGIRPIRMRMTGDHMTRIWAAVPSKSQPGLEHIVCLNAETGEARHAETDCHCPAALHGRPCWHTTATVEAAREAGYLPKTRPSVFDTPAPRDPVQEI